MDGDRWKKVDMWMKWAVSNSSQDLINSYSCSCDDGWEGSDCDVNTDECASLPCVHGTCVVCVYGCMAVWLYGCMNVWLYGCMDV